MEKNLARAVNAILLLSLMLSPAAVPANLIANENLDVEALSSKKIKSIFLGSTTHWDNGSPISLCIMKDASGEVEEYLKTYVGKNSRSLKRHWTKKVFSGNAAAMPVYPKSVKKAWEFLKKRDGAICIVIAVGQDGLSEIKNIPTTP